MRLHRFTDGFDADRFERGKIKPVFSKALGRFEIDVSEYDLIAVERHDLEAGARATLADFLGIKTTSALRQIIYNTLDQRRLAATGTTCKQNFFGHNARL